MNKIKILIFPVAILLFTVSCAQQPSKETRTPTKTRQQLIKLCKEEYSLDIITKAFDNTLWVYLPLDKSFLSIAASKDGPIKSLDSEKKWDIKFLDAEFTNHSFHLRYDIALKKSYTSNNGITTKYSEEFRAKQSYLLGAITRAYSEIEKKPESGRYVEKVEGDVDFLGYKENTARKELVHSYVKTDAVPSFFVVVIADIEKGIETRMYLYLQDLRRAAVDQGFGEEYIKRVVMDQPIGHEIIIGDKTGSHLEAHDLTWSEFLTKQMLYRITFKYTSSSFPPYPDTIQQLTEIAAETIQGYDFNGFESIVFTDLDTETTRTLSKEHLKAVEITPPNLPGKIHHLKFEIKSPEGNETNY